MGASRDYSCNRIYIHAYNWYTGAGIGTSTGTAASHRGCHTLVENLKGGRENTLHGECSRIAMIDRTVYGCTYGTNTNQVTNKK